MSVAWKPSSDVEGRHQIDRRHHPWVHSHPVHTAPSPRQSVAISPFTPTVSQLTPVLIFSSCAGLFTGCIPVKDDDTSTERAGETTSDVGGGDPGSATDDLGDSGTTDGVTPRITDGYAVYDDVGELGIVAGFGVAVEDPDDDLNRGVFRIGLNGGAPYEYPIGGSDVTYNNGWVTLIFSNVEPQFYTVEMQVIDSAGHESNVWEGQTEWSSR